MSTHQIYGVVNNGGWVSATLPSNRKPLEIARGESLVVLINVTDTSQVPYALADAALALVFTVRRAPGLGALLTQTATKLPARGPNIAQFSFTGEQTKFLDPGIYLYDVWLTTASGREQVCPMSHFKVTPTLLLT